MFEEYTKAIDAVRKACVLCQTVQKKLVNEESISKKDKSPVTVADYGAQAVINHILRTEYPNDPIVGEEESSFLRDPNNSAVKDKVVEQVQHILPELKEEEILASIDYGNYEGGSKGRHWTLDPIDGTKGFLRGDQYAVALGLIEDGEVVFGVLGCPNLPKHMDQPAGMKGCLFFAAKERGAFMQMFEGDAKVSIKTSKTQDPTKASMCEPVESAHAKHDDSAKIAEILGVQGEPVRIDSQCKYAILARGDASIYLRMPTRIDYEENIWDHAAGWIIVKEAGGEITDIVGNPLNFSLGRTLKSNKGTVASNGQFHVQIIDAIRQVLNLA